MGETISDQSHAARILLGLPESWGATVKALRVFTSDPKKIIEKLKGQEVFEEASGNRNAAKSAVPSIPKSIQAQALVSANLPRDVCEICEKPNHTQADCFNPGGGRDIVLEVDHN